MQNSLDFSTKMVQKLTKKSNFVRIILLLIFLSRFSILEIILIFSQFQFYPEIEFNLNPSVIGNKSFNPRNSIYQIHHCAVTAVAIIPLNENSHFAQQPNSFHDEYKFFV